MFDLSLLLPHITTVTGITQVALDMGNEPTGSLGTPPRIQIGYEAIKSEGSFGDGATPDPYNEFLEDLNFIFYTQLSCDTTVFPATWVSLYKAVRGYIPLPSEANYSGIYYSGGDSKGLANGRIWWVDFWRIDFPRVTASI